ncbi:LRR and PYD domains-containing 3-like protein [Labeo rohita]|uniref:LRR and PYD domains-containing 3-like protein n=1 Tax=Labeo rohita TaxID=84645 RepID=A0A498M3S8_LABRO|nr:LRR and PYD domains-containing 3-like protein [Labeo rohita]
MDLHLTTHTELTKAAQRDTLQTCKRRKILEDLASLRASNPVEPMVSTLDIEEAQNFWDVSPAPEEEECGNLRYKEKRESYKPVQDIINSMLEKGVICPCNSTYSAPIWPVLKRQVVANRRL